MTPSTPPAQQPHPPRCEMCKNKKCPEYQQRGVSHLQYIDNNCIDSKNGSPKEYRVYSPKYFTELYGCASHSSTPAREQPFVDFIPEDARTIGPGIFHLDDCIPQQPPASAADAPSCPYSADDDMCLECKAHEERIARQAREDVLKAAIRDLENLKNASSTREGRIAYGNAIAILRGEQHE